MESNPEKIEKHVLPTMKAALLNKKGILPDEACYTALSGFIDKLAHLLRLKRGTTVDGTTLGGTTVMSESKGGNYGEIYYGKDANVQQQVEQEKQEQIRNTETRHKFDSQM
jgi:hypothetical protein